MELQIPQNIEFELEKTVTTDETAAKYGSGLVEVYATPAMIAFMEKTCLESVLAHLPEGYNTVGINVNINHLKATPVGMKVTCKSILTEVDGRKLTFKLEAFDEEGKIGEGTHSRFVINTEKFMKKLSGNA